MGVIKFPLKLGKKSYEIFDQGWSEYFGGQILYNQLKSYSLYIQEFQNNNLKIYLLSYILWVIILLIITLFLK
jgi:NADH-ubiquinone oxidoreductase chain 5